MKKDKFDIFLEGETVNLVILNDFIAKNSDWYSWLNYKKNTELLQQGRFPNSKEKSPKNKLTTTIVNKSLKDVGRFKSSVFIFIFNSSMIRVSALFHLSILF